MNEIEKQVLVSRERQKVLEKDLAHMEGIKNKLAEMRGSLDALLNQLNTTEVKTTVIGGNVEGDMSGEKIIK